jgi:hypothetical protein
MSFFDEWPGKLSADDYNIIIKQFKMPPNADLFRRFCRYYLGYYDMTSREDPITYIQSIGALRYSAISNTFAAFLFDNKHKNQNFVTFLEHYGKNDSKFLRENEYIRAKLVALGVSCHDAPEEFYKDILIFDESEMYGWTRLNIHGFIGEYHIHSIFLKWLSENEKYKDKSEVQTLLRFFPIKSDGDDQFLELLKDSKASFLPKRAPSPIRFDKPPPPTNQPEPVPAPPELDTTPSTTAEQLITVIGDDPNAKNVTKECVICLEGPKEIVLIPCAHICICQNCSLAPSLTTCPVCRTTITLKTKFYLC